MLPSIDGYRISILIFTICVEVAIFRLPVKAILREYLIAVPGDPFQSLANEFFTLSKPVDGRCVDCGHPQIKRCPDGFDGLLFICSAPHPATNGPCAEGERTYLHICIPELLSFHMILFP